MVWLHPVALEQEVSVDIKVARVISADIDTKFFLNILPIKILADPVEFSIAQVAIFALLADIIDVLTGTLEWTNHSIVAVDTCGDTRPDTLAIVAILD